MIDGTVTGGMSPNRGRAYQDQAALIADLKRMVKPGDVLLFKASRGMHLELVLEGFLNEEK